MAVVVALGAALEGLMGELLKVVVAQTKQTAKFKTLLKRLEKTLRNVKPILYETRRLSILLDHPENETIMFMEYVKNGKMLVLKCSKIKCWNVYKKFVHANKLIRLDNEIVRFFQIEVQANMTSTSTRALIGIYDLSVKMDQVLTAVTNRAGGFSGSCSVPGLPDLIIGLDWHLEELKHRLLKDDTQVVVLSAPGGCGKTTLAKMLCHDDEIRGIFGGNILYVTVSRKTNIKTIIQKIFDHHGLKLHCEFQTDVEAKNQLEKLLRQTASDSILLVLDDVWSESESVIRDLKFQIPGYKILVTSRFLLPRFNSTYELSLLNDEDAGNLLCYSAFPNNGIPINVPDDLVNKMVKCCKGFPLALTVIGASLCGQGVLRWKTTLKKWSEGQSIFDSNSGLLLSLQASIDALDELPTTRECFLDLGLFPEDESIPATVLMDMWVELYNLDDEGMYTSENLLELSLRNLVKLVPTRNDASELEGYCNEHYVTQHDLLRELAIHLMSSQEPTVKRKRLLMEIHGNDLPRWWIEQIEQPIDARLLSISTDEAFSSSWYDLKAPKVEVLILNLRSRKYTLPQFMEGMDQLKVLNITNYGLGVAEVNNLPLIGSLSNLRRMRFQHVSIPLLNKTIFDLKSLTKISFVMCKICNTSKDYIIDTPDFLPNLAELEIDRCNDLKELPEGICRIAKLKKLSITYCHELDALPEGLGNLLSLEVLRLHSCTKLQALPESIGKLRNLIFLDISDCLSINTLPEQIGELCGLRVLRMSGCHGLQELPESVSYLSHLEDVICDEETSYLWRNYEYDLNELKINVVEADTFGNLMKVFAPSKLL